MSWRTVIISNRCKLDSKMGYMVIRGEETVRIFMDEIAILIIENPAVSLTGCLLEDLNERKIRVIFCDSERSPMAELVPHHGSHDTTRKLRLQIGWQEETKGTVWRAIVADKIEKQAQHLADRAFQREALLLESYLPQIEFRDRTNREGHAAKVYFNALFGMDFSRRDDHPINAALNYGYSILLSAFNREISAAGYCTELGLFHDNVFNHFNLSSDLMEPFRVLIDRKVWEYKPKVLDKDIKYRLINTLNDSVKIEHTEQRVSNAIRIYVNSVLNCLAENNPSGLIFYHI